MLKFALDTLENYPAGITLATLIGECVSRIEGAAPSVSVTWKQFVAQAKLAAMLGH